MAPPTNSSAMMNQRRRANMTCPSLVLDSMTRNRIQHRRYWFGANSCRSDDSIRTGMRAAPASAAGRLLNRSSSKRRLSGSGSSGVAHQDLLVVAGDLGVKGARGFGEVG